MRSLFRLAWLHWLYTMVTRGNINPDVQPRIRILREDIITQPHKPDVLTQILFTPDNYDITGAIHEGCRSNPSER